jgi:hypothetical protein
MTPTERLHILADWNRTGQYDHALSDITPYVLSAQWNMGFDTPYQMVAPPSQMTLLLDNSAGQWNVTNPAALFTGLLKRDVLIRAQYDDAGSWKYLIALKIVDIQIPPGVFGPRVISVVCQDWHSDLMSAIYDPVLATNQTTGEALTAMFTSLSIPSYPSWAGWWMIGASILGETTILADYTAYQGNQNRYFVMFPGDTTLDYVGDNLDANGGGVSALAFIEEMCTAEMTGRWRFQINTANGNPMYVFYDRTALAGQYSAGNAKTIYTSELDSAEYVYGQNHCNQIEITAYPRKTGSVGTEIARNDSPIPLDGLSSRTITLRYRDPDNPGGTCAASTIITPVASTDYTANLAADGSGADYTVNLSVSVVNKTNAAEITLSNTALGRIYVTLLKIRGTPLTAQQPVTTNAVDAASISSYGLAKQARTIAGVDDPELVERYANYYVRLFSTPRAEFRSIGYSFTDQTSDALKGVVLTPMPDTYALKIQDDWLEGAAAGRPFWIAGMNCTINAAAQTWGVSLVLEDYTASAGYWQLGNADLGVLGTTTRLGF